MKVTHAIAAAALVIGGGAFAAPQVDHVAVENSDVAKVRVIAGSNAEPEFLCTWFPFLRPLCGPLNK
ncbi:MULTISPECIES: hypothetical protein [unclassified Actinobaculum]|uniref:hypothetical protein n=1 Tax=unclassified Actinobaculum TaxID=2609299 RepID=UPI000D526707|nr:MULTISPECIES: hypothetical protein [unclassified Actinobaculum]AWE43232.1 hypothetical protein DDD63_11310 [Actinobaculum sp. 313]RTE49868.1 hypothetical protein EKN07_04925 [Actinobaculum sp. 352]